MRKTCLALIISSLCLAQTQLMADEQVLAANQNFGPRPSTPEAPPPPVTAQPAPAAVQPAPAPAQPAPVTVAPAPAAPATVQAAPPVTPPITPKPAPVAPVSQAAKDEVLRRQTAQVEARLLIDHGQKLYYDNKLPEAIARLEQALKILPRARATEIEANRAKHTLTIAYYRLADAALREGNTEKARELAKKALEYDRNNLPAENILVKLKWTESAAQSRAKRVADAGVSAVPTEPGLDETPEFVAKKEQIKKLFREGRILMNSGQFDEAEKRFKQVLLIDHYNDDAFRLLSDLQQQRTESAEVGYEAVHAERMWQVSDAWLPPYSQQVKLPAPGSAKAVSSSKEAVQILEKLNQIRFPDLNFREANINDVVQFLSSESRRLDPAKQGVNIVLGAGVVSPAAAPAPGAEGTPAPTSGTARPVTLALKDVPMIEALKYVTSLAQLKYRIEPSAVLILPIDAAEGTMVLRFYPVTPGAIETAVATPTTPAAGGGFEGGATGGLGTMGGASGSIAPGGDVKQFFIDSGVPFPAGSNIKYDKRTSKISVKNTPENLELFERALAELNVIPSQVEIEAKFVDISQGDLKELGFQWSVGASDPWKVGRATIRAGAGQIGSQVGTATNEVLGFVQGLLTGGLRNSGNLPGSAVESLLQGASQGDFLSAVASGSILSQPDLQFMINALSQKKSADVLSAPKVTTISGAQAQIRVVQEFIYPTEFSTPSAGDNVITASIPAGFRTREVGVILNVTPTVGADGYTINLTLVPEVSEFRGFIDYSPPPTTQETGSGRTIEDENGNRTEEMRTQTIEYKILQPLFETRNIQTSVVLWDGQTVVLGGLMREDVQKIDDKVPVLGDIPILGRLFRSKVTSRSKRNLLIFVTANLIDPAGNRIHRP